MEMENKIRSPPKFENPDRAFDNQDQMNEQEELEKEQEVRLWAVCLSVCVSERERKRERDG